MKWLHTEKFRVRGYEVGHDGKAPVQTYCAYMEEAAGINAATLGAAIEKLQAEGLTWVLARMQLEIDNLPQTGDEVVVKTWPVNVEKAQFRRDFNIADNTGKPLARAITDWVVLNLESRRLERMPAFVAALQPEDAPKVMEKEKFKFPASANVPELSRFVVRKSDIDRNLHVNNVRFLDWMLESVPEDFVKGRKLAGLQIIFRAEAVYGDTVIAKGYAEPENTCGFLHGLFRETDGLELVRAKSIWE